MVLLTEKTKLSSLFVLILFISCSMSEFQKPKLSSDQYFVNQLISEYFIAEQHLWSIRNIRSENTLNEIYSANQFFLNKSLDVPLRKSYRYSFSSFDTFDNAQLFNLKIGDPLKYPIQIDKPDIFLSTNLTLDILEGTETFFNSRSDLSFWKDVSNKTNYRYFQSNNLESAYQIILHMYEETQMVLLKNYITVQVILLFQNYFLAQPDQESETYYNQATTVRHLFKQRFLKIWENVHQFSKTSNKEFRRGDEQLSDLSDYLQITNFLNRFVDNEVNFNQESSCTKSCSDYKQSRQYHCYEGTLCNPCEGTVRECEDSNVEMGSWTRWFVKCSNCLCICDKKSNDENSSRYFSLRDVVSNTADNKIVTGVKISQHNGIIKLNIAQRKLLPFAMISSAESELSGDIWESIDTSFNISDANIRKDVDYHELTYDQRALNLDTVSTTKGSLVTGVRFHILDGHLSLQIRATEFDYATGQLKDIEKSQWISNLNGGKNKIHVQGSKKQTKWPNDSMPYDVLGAYVEFSPGIYEHDKRLSQFTVPFFNPYKVEPYVPTALSGVGLFLTGQRDYVGFVTVKLVVYDFEEKLTLTLD